MKKSNEYLLNLTLLYSEKSEKYSRNFLMIARNMKEDLDKTIKNNNLTKEEIHEIIESIIKYYLEAYRTDHKNIDLVLELSELHRAIDKHKDSLGFIDLAMKIDKNDYRIYFEGYSIYDEIGDLHSAKEMIKLSIILNIEFIEGYNILGNILHREKLFVEAIEIFTIALNRDPENMTILNNLGNCYLETVKKYNL